MATQLLNERRRSLSQAAQFCGVSTGAAVRWALYGIQGGRLKLESFRLGGKRFTSQEAIERFIAAQNPDPSVGIMSVASSAVEARIAAAEAELAESGI